jgi:hypothetical protein
MREKIVKKATIIFAAVLLALVSCAPRFVDAELIRDFEQLEAGLIKPDELKKYNHNYLTRDNMLTIGSQYFAKGGEISEYQGERKSAMGFYRFTDYIIYLNAQEINDSFDGRIWNISHIEMEKDFAIIDRAVTPHINPNESSWMERSDAFGIYFFDNLEQLPYGEGVTPQVVIGYDFDRDEFWISRNNEEKYRIGIEEVMSQ